MSFRRLVPADVDPEHLSDLVADCRAIPAAAFTRSKRASRLVIDLTVVPQQRTVVRIPEASRSLVEAAEGQLVGYRR
jgi:hypothetical protein